MVAATPARRAAAGPWFSWRMTRTGAVVDHAAERLVTMDRYRAVVDDDDLVRGAALPDHRRERRAEHRGGLEGGDNDSDANGPRLTGRCVRTA